MLDTPFAAEIEAPWPPMQVMFRTVMLLPLFTADVTFQQGDGFGQLLTCDAVVSIEDVPILDQDIVPAHVVSVRVEGEVLGLLPKIST